MAAHAKFINGRLLLRCTPEEIASLAKALGKLKSKPDLSGHVQVICAEDNDDGLPVIKQAGN